MSRPVGSAAADFTAAVAGQLLTRACEATGLDGSDAVPMRLGENALFHLPSISIVVRVARTMNYWDDVSNEVNVARWLFDVGFPAAEVADVPQPIEVDGHPVTFWRYIPGRDGNRHDIGTLGRVLRELHALRRPTSFDLPREDILGRIESRIANSEAQVEDKTFLLGRLEKLRGELPRLRFPLRSSPTHGDAHSENIRIHNGVPILLDFERFAWGQPEWDLAMTATEYKTAGWWSAREYDLFAESYGYDVTTWSEGFDILRQVHELKMTTWLMQNVNESPAVADEFQVRMRTIRDGVPARWRPF